MPSDHAHTVQSMQQRLMERFAPLCLEIIDDSAKHAGHAGAAQGGGHFSVRLVSHAFSGCTRLQRQRLVYDLLADLMKRDIHALSMSLLTPEEADRR